MSTALDARDLVARAKAYPFDVPRGSYLLAAGRAVPLDAAPEPTAAPLLAFGANAAPSALARKLGDRAAHARIPVVAAELHDFDVVYSAHVSPYGAIPGALQHCPGTVAHVHVIHPAPEDAAILDATEPNYALARLDGVELRLESGERLDAVHAYLTRHGCLSRHGEPVAVAAIPASGRRWPALDEPGVLALARDRLAPGEELDDFVVANVREPELAARRTDALRADALPFAWPRA